MNFKDSYHRDDFLLFLKDLIPGIAKDVRPVSLGSGYKAIKNAIFLGSSDELDLSIFELKIEGKAEKKIFHAKEGFRLMKEYQAFKALAVYFSEEDRNWRLSLMQMTPERTENGKTTQKFSNPRRYSFYLGPQAKTKTPENFLIKKGVVKDFEDLLSRFSVEVVNKEFYKEIAKFFRRLVGGDVKLGSNLDHFEQEMTLPSVDKTDHNTYQEFAVRLIGRVIFCWFLKQKKSSEGISLLSDEFLSTKAVELNDNYYHNILERIFFEILNKPLNQRNPEFSNTYGKIPYLNGGLFDPHNDDFYENQPNWALKIPDDWFLKLFEILETYNFTIDENTVLDADLSIDPEMLGRIFENLLAEINPETGESARKSTGSYYTPRPIVEYMVDQSLVQYLLSKTRVSEEKIKALISVDELDDELYPLIDQEKQKIIAALDEVKIIDPACGSGAFPIGILQKIVFVLGKIDQNGQLWFEKKTEDLDPLLKEDFKKKFANENFDYIRKTGVIRDSIYGVDIQPIAVEVSKLRCFLTLIVDEDIDENAENRGIKPLPNLEFKFVAANTLIDLPGSGASDGRINLFEDDSGINQLKKLRDQYFVSNGYDKERIKSKFKDIQREMFKNQIGKGGQGTMTMALAAWNPFADESSSWFDPEWMFGTKNFDVVIANPPYETSRSKGISEQEKKYLQNNYETAEDKFDYYVFFIEKSAKISKPLGVVCLITPSTYLTKPLSKKIRSFLLRNKILDIKEFKGLVFQAVVPTAIIIFQVDSPSAEHTVNIGLNINNINQFMADGYNKKILSQNLFKGPDYYINIYADERFHLFYSKLHNLDQIICLGNLAEIYNGIQTGKDEKFVSYENKSEAWEPVITGSDIRKYYKKWGGKYVHFNPSMLHSNTRKNIFKTDEKIIIRQTSDRIIAVYDNESFFTLASTFVIKQFDRKLSYKSLLAILNSNLFLYLYRNLNNEEGRILPQIKKKHIFNLPIKLEFNETHLVEIVDKVISTTKSDDYLENYELQAKVEKYEHQIDQIVYKLYDLTQEEIKIIEEARI